MSSGLVVGLTGGIGCGKSAVGDILQSLGLLRLDTDQVAREVVAPGTSGLAEIVSHFGNGILAPGGELDRAAMGRLVFAEPEKKKALEKILHPLIWSVVTQFIESCRAAGKDAVVEVPLLYENSRQDSFDKVWVVSSKPELQMARLKTRNGWSEDEVKARIANQMPLAEKVAKADTVIPNNGTPQELQRLVREAWLRESREQKA